MGNEEKLKILIEAQNKSNAAFAEANKNIEATNKKFGELGAKADKIAGGMKKAGAIMTAGLTTPIVLGANSAVNAASSLEESINAVNVVFGDAAEGVHAWSDQTVESMGLSRRAFNEAITPIGAMLINMGLDAGDTADMTGELATRAADLASVFNTDLDSALTAIQAGLRGEADPLERFGVGLSAAAVKAHALEEGMIAAGQEMDDTTKANARLDLFFKQTNKVAGDFVNTSDGIANKARLASAKLEEQQAVIGKKLIPVKQKLLDIGIKILDWFDGLDANGQKVVLMVIGVVAAMGPMLIILGQLITVIKGVSIALTILSANPAAIVIGALILAIALGAFLIIKNWDTLKKWMGDFWGWLQDKVSGAVGFIKDNWGKIVAIMLGPIGLVVVAIIKNFDTIKAIVKGTIGAFKALVGGIKTAFSTIFKIITTPYRLAFNAISKMWNSTVGKLSFTAPDWVPGIGGKGFSMPKLPTLFRGARNFGGGPAIVGDINGRGGEIVNVPQGSDVFTNSESKRILRSLADGGGGGRTVHIGTVILESAEASREFFNQLDNDSLLQGRGLTPNRGQA